MSWLSEEYSKQKKKYDDTRSSSSGISIGKINIPTMNEMKEWIRKGPTGGTPKHVADQLYGGSTKDAVTSIQNFYKDTESAIRNIIPTSLPSLPLPGLNTEDDDDTNKTFVSSQGSSSVKDIGGGRTKERIFEDSRTQANLTGKRRSSLLTS